MTQRQKLRTAGQTKSNISPSPNELEGWTSQGSPRRAPQTRSASRTLYASTSLYPLKKSSGQKKKKKGENYIPRPLNSFILFRNRFVADLKANGSSTSGLSRLAGDAWKRLPKAEKAEWESQAKEEKRQHAITYPGYKYQPRRANAKPKVQSRQEREIEENSVTFHSSPESSPAPSSADSPTNENDASLAVPAVNAIPNVPAHSRFIGRRQSLRLSNWDDSVLYPQKPSSSKFFDSHSDSTLAPQSSYSPALVDFQSQNYNPDALQPRSSPVPIPLPTNANPRYPTSGNSHVYDDHSSRFSYSGIRPGFAFQSMGSLESLSMRGDAAPLPQTLVAGPSDGLFGDYYLEVNNTTNPSMFVSPIRDIMPPNPQFDMNDSQEWSYTHSPENVNSASESSPSASNLTAPPMLSFEEFMAANPSPEDLFNQVESITFNVPHETFGQGSLLQSNQKDSNTKRVHAADEGCFDSNFVMNLDPRLLDLSTTPPEDAFTGFCYTQDSGTDTDFDSTWNLFEVK